MHTNILCNQQHVIFYAYQISPKISRIPPILRPVVYCTAIAHGMNNFEFARDKFASSTGTDKTQLLTALGCSRDSESISL